MVPGGLTLVACLGALLLSLGVRVEADDVIHKVVGSDVTLVPKFTGSPSEINWKVDGNKLVEMELSPYRRKFYRLEDRATIDDKDGRLTITKLVIGDTGQYKAEVLVNNNINYTTINLIVLECPSLPTVKYRIVAENTLELDCENSTANVKYEWKQGAKHLSDHQLFNVSRTNELVYMTCVVSNDACERNVTVPIHPVYSDYRWFIIGGVCVVAFLIFIIFVLCYLINKLNCKCNRLIKVQQEEEGAAFFRGPLQNQLIAQEVQQEEEEGAAFIRGPLQNQLIAQDPICRSVSLKINPENVENIPFMNLCKVGDLSVESKLNPEAEGKADAKGDVPKAPRTFASLCVTLDNMEKADDCCADITLQNGQTCKCTIKAPADMAIMTSNGKGIKLDVHKAAEVKTIVLKKDNETLYDLSVEGAEIKIKDMTLVTGENHLLIKNLKPKDSGKYHVDLHSSDNHVTSNTFNLEVTDSTKCKKRKVNVMVKRLPTDSLPENEPTKDQADPSTENKVTSNTNIREELPENEPFYSITFHPVNITNVASVTWKKKKKEGGEETVVTENDRIHISLEGDLTINHVLPEDKGIYVIYSENQEVEQEFNFR